MDKRIYKPSKKAMKKVFILCWVVYFCANMGRLSYSAVMASVIIERGFSQSQCGLVGTSLYVCYGASQLITGLLGDKLESRSMILFGMSLSAVMNLGMGIVATPGQMILIWGINGIAQAMLWPPIIRIFSERLYGEYRKKACVHISTTFAVGTLAIYFLAGMLLDLIGYRGIFFATAALVGVAGIGFFVVYGRVERGMKNYSHDVHASKKNTGDSEKKYHWVRVEIVWMLGITCLILIMQGILRDGVTSWVPAYLNDVYQKGLQTSTLATMVLPIVNLGGVYVAEIIRKKSMKSEINISGILFAAAVVATAIMVVFGELHIVIAVSAFAVITSCMLGINTMLVNVIPVYFAWTGRIALISGILNSSVYIGSSLALYGIGMIAEKYDWNVLLICLGGVAVVGTIFCLVDVKLWKKINRCQK